MTLADKTALCLEDNALIAFDIAEGLKSAGFCNVELAYDLSGANELADRLSIDFAVLDFDLGAGTNSAEFGRRLIGSGTKVVFASGYDLSPLSKQIPYFDILEKPLKRQDLFDLVKRTFPQ